MATEMVQKVILVASIMAFASVASAALWKECESTNTTINVNVDFCDPNLSTIDRCAVEIDSIHNVQIDYIQPEPNIRPWFKWGYVDPITNELRRHQGSFTGCLFALECPGQPDQEQHFEVGVRFVWYEGDSRKPTLRIKIEGDHDSLHLCVDIPLKIVGDILI